MNNVDTYCGKTLNEVLENISKKRSAVNFLDDYPYYKIEEYENVLIEALGGRKYYKTIFSDLQVVPVGKDVLMTCTCHLSFITDERQIGFETSGIGSFRLKRKKSGDGFLALDNAALMCQYQAFKSACRTIQIFGIHSSDDIESQSLQIKPKPICKDKVSSASTKSNEAFQRIFVTQSLFEKVREDKHGKPTWKVSVCDKDTGEVADVIFYPNQYAKNNDLFNKLLACCGDGKPHDMRLMVSACSNAANVYVFKDFWK